jgi:hypothetical protein
MRSKMIIKAAGFLFAVSLSVPAWAASGSQPSDIATPGTVNYVEGQVRLGPQALNSSSIGSAKLDPNQFISTANGKAEVLLTPGVFLRLGNNSSLQMISPDLANTQVALDKGEATVEVTQILKANNIQVNQGGAATQLLKRGFYDFDANNNAVRVIEGEAILSNGSRRVKVKAGHEASVGNNTVSKARSFDKDTYETSDLYRWGSLRSAYLAEANADAAPLYVSGGFGWYGADWYWNPYFDAYTFIPGDGIFYSPFGWGFYSPFYAGWAPFGFGYGYGLYGNRYYHHFGNDYRSWDTRGYYAGGAQSGRGGFAGGGFRGGHAGGGFHGGSAGGGFHGGGGFGGHGR